MDTHDYVIRLKDGRRLGFAEYGDPQGKPLFFFHGWPTCRLHAIRPEPIAKKLGIRIISVDRPGFGLSDYKQNRTLLDFPDDVVELADHLNLKKFAVAGASGGGPYSAVCAYKIPHRITRAGIVVGIAPTYIKGVLDDLPILIKIGWGNYDRFPLLATLASLIHFLNAKLGPFLGPKIFPLGAKSDQQILTNRQIRQTIKDGLKEAFRNGYKGAEQDLKIYSKNWGFELKDIKAKVFLWYGQNDQNVTLEMGKYYASQIPNSTLIIYPGEGHLCQITHAEEILKTLVS